MHNDVFICITAMSLSRATMHVCGLNGDTLRDKRIVFRVVCLETLPFTDFSLVELCIVRSEILSGKRSKAGRCRMRQGN
jgi:hypothetical protein